MILLILLLALFLPNWAANPACIHSILATYRSNTITHFWPEPTPIYVDPFACDSYWSMYQFCKSAVEIDATTAKPPDTDTRPFEHFPTGCASFAEALGIIYDVCGWLKNGFPTTIGELDSAQFAALETGSPLGKGEGVFCPVGYKMLTAYKDTYDYYMCCPQANNQMLLPNNGPPVCCNRGDKPCDGQAVDILHWCSQGEEVTDYFGTKGCRVRRSDKQQRNIPWSSGSPYPIAPLPTGTYSIPACTNSDFTQYDTGSWAWVDYHTTYEPQPHPTSTPTDIRNVSSYDGYSPLPIPPAPPVPTPQGGLPPGVNGTGSIWIPFATRTSTNPKSSHYYPASTAPSHTSSKHAPESSWHNTIPHDTVVFGTSTATHPIITAKDALPENDNAPPSYITSLGPGRDWGNYPDPANTDAPTFHCGFNGCGKGQLEVWVGRDCLCTSTVEQVPVHGAITGFISDVAERDVDYTRHRGPPGPSKSGTTTVTITIPRSSEPTTFSTITSAAKLDVIMTGAGTLTVGGMQFQWIDGICGFCNSQSSHDFKSGNGMPFGISSDDAKKFCSASTTGCPEPTHT